MMIATSDTLIAAYIAAGVAGIGAAAKLAWSLMDRRRGETTAATERRREDRRNAEARYQNLAGRLVATLHAVTRGEASREQAAEAYIELQGYGKGEFRSAFGSNSVVVWAERRVRSILDGAVQLVPAALDERIHDDAVEAASDAIEELEMDDMIDEAEAERRYRALPPRSARTANTDILEHLQKVADDGLAYVLGPEAAAAIAHPDETITLEEASASSPADRATLEQLTATHGGHRVDG